MHNETMVWFEHDPAPIRHIIIQCPECLRHFNARDITEDDITYDIDIQFAHFDCPSCGAEFSCRDGYSFTEIEVDHRVIKELMRCAERTDSI